MVKVVSGTAVVVAIVYAAINSESIRRLVVPESLLMKTNSDDAVTVARGIAVRRVKIAPSAPAVSNSTVLEGASVVTVATAVTTAVAVLGVCANGAVNVLAMIVSF
jgi:hypothetical protein